MPDLRLIRAEILKLRRRRGLLAAARRARRSRAPSRTSPSSIVLHALDPAAHAAAGGAGTSTTRWASSA